MMSACKVKLFSVILRLIMQGVGVIKILFFLLLLAASGCYQEATIKLALNNQSKVCFFGDGGSGSKQQYVLAKLLEKEKCDAYFYLGDIIYPSGIESENDPALKDLFWKPYGSLLKTGSLFLAMGNHDFKGNIDSWLKIASKSDKLYYPAHYYLTILNKMCFITLNTVDHRLEQILWLKNLDLKGCEEKILIGHHPIVSSGKHKGAYFPLNLFLGYAASKADVYVSGHDHQLSYEGKISGIHQFISGSAGKLRPVDEDKAVWAKSKHGYLVMEKRAGELIFTFWGIDPNKSGQKQKLFIQKI